MPLRMINEPTMDVPGLLINVFATNHTVTVTNTIGVTG
jgi:hypothetical protein